LIPSKAVRGSQEWTKRVLELIDRDCMSDFEELCELMGVPVMPITDEQSMEAILSRIRKLHEEEQEQGGMPEAACSSVPSRPPASAAPRWPHCSGKSCTERLS